MVEKANYKLSFSVNDGIVEIVLTGELNKHAIDMVHAEVIKILKENNAKAALADVRYAKGPQDITSAFFRVRNFPLEYRFWPLAIVDRPVNEEFKSFYMTTAANVGQSLKWFTDIDEARAWLKGKFKH